MRTATGLPGRSPLATRKSRRAVTKPPKPAARHMSTQTGQAAWQGDTVRHVCSQTPAWQGETAAHSHKAGANRPGMLADRPQLRVSGRPYSITTQGGEVVSLWPVVLEGSGIIGYWVKENRPAFRPAVGRAIQLLADRQCKLDFTYLAAALRSSQ